MIDKLRRKVTPGLTTLAILAGSASAQTVGPSGETASVVVSDAQAEKALLELDALGKSRVERRLEC